MWYGILDNQRGILVEHKDKNYLLKKYYNNELEIKRNKDAVIVNKVKTTYKGHKSIILIEII